MKKKAMLLFVLIVLAIMVMPVVYAGRCEYDGVDTCQIDRENWIRYTNDNIKKDGDEGNNELRKYCPHVNKGSSKDDYVIPKGAKMFGEDAGIASGNLELTKGFIASDVRCSDDNSKVLYTYGHLILKTGWCGDTCIWNKEKCENEEIKCPVYSICNDNRIKELRLGENIRGDENDLGLSMTWSNDYDTFDVVYCEHYAENTCGLYTYSPPQVMWQACIVPEQVYNDCKSYLGADYVEGKSFIQDIGCCGYYNPPYSDAGAGAVKIKSNKEYVCTQDDQGKWMWIEASSGGIFTYTRLIEDTKTYYLDLISNSMPHKEGEQAKCTDIASPETDFLGNDYYAYDGSNLGWIGCKAEETFPLGLFESSTTFTTCTPNPHIRQNYDRVRMNSRFAASEPGGEGEDPDNNIDRAFIPLMESDVIVPGEGNENQLCAPQGGMLCQRGQEICDGRVIKSSDTSRTYLCCAGTCQAVSATLPNILPEFMCVKRNNIGFWAGCVADIDDKPSHNFYPGGMPTTFKDFGTTAYGDGINEPKPGSMFLYNKVLALGVSTLGAYIKYGWTYDIDLEKYGDAEFFYDWSGYDKLVFHFKAAKKPEAYTIYFKSASGGNCLELPYSPYIKDLINIPAKPNKWYKIEIPLDDISIEANVKKNMCGLGIRTTEGEIIGLAPDLAFPLIDNTKSFRDLVFLDRFTLVSGTENEYYCALVSTSGSQVADVAYWINSLNHPQVCNEQPGHTWTGSQCCGDDSLETYEEPNTEYGYACYDGVAIPSNSFLNENVLVYGGEFYSCSSTSPVKSENVKGACEGPYNLIDYNPSENSYTLNNLKIGREYDIKIIKTGDDVTITLTDAVENSLTVDSNFYTGDFMADSNTVTLDFSTTTGIEDVVVMEKNLANVYHCSADGTWNEDSYIGASTDISELKDSLKELEDKDSNDISSEVSSYDSLSSCCPADYCWNGTVCKESGDLLEGNNYLCVNGKWEEARLKCDPDTTHICDNTCTADQCYHKRDGCVDADTQISGTKHYCEGIKDETGKIITAEWTTRTEIIAVQLSKFAESESKYTLSCDDKSKVLNKDNGITDTNNFCVLKYGNSDKIAFGTTFNSGITDFVNLLPGASFDCSDVTQTDGEFHQCSGDNRLWYNPSLNGIIYAKNRINLGSMTTWWASFKDFLKNLFGIDSPSAHIDFIKKRPFDTLYIFDNGNKNIRGVIGKENGDSFVRVEYFDFVTDICADVNRFYPTTPNICTTDATNNVQIVEIDSVQYNTINSKINNQDIWLDLTSKLRIQ